MIELFYDLNDAYGRTAQFLTRTVAIRRNLIDSGRPRTDPEVMRLQNVIELTESQLHQLAETMRKIKSNI